MGWLPRPTHLGGPCRVAFYFRENERVNRERSVLLAHPDVCHEFMHRWPLNSVTASVWDAENVESRVGLDFVFQFRERHVIETSKWVRKREIRHEI